MVHSRGLRFDFSHFSKVTTEELIQVENFVNARIREGLSLKEKRNIPLQIALDEGAIALFGEKYGDTVRTIKFGNSVELCGGTHVENTKDIWHFILLHEGAVASGIRRIEAITGEFAKDFFISNSNKFKEVKKVLQNTKDPLKSIVTLQEENSDLILKCHMSDVFLTWVPPHNSIEFPKRMVRTASPYFSPKRAIAPSETACSIGTARCSSNANFPSIRAFTKFSISFNSSGDIFEKCEKSNRKYFE
jgi:hypothetical protein